MAPEQNREAEATGGSARELTLSRLRAMVDTTTDAIIVVAPNGRIDYFNDAYLAMWGFPREAIHEGVAADVRERVAAQMRDPRAHRERMARILEAKEAQTHDVLERADGRIVERFSRLASADGAEIGRVWTFRDITAQRVAEAALRDETHLLELLNRMGMKFTSQLDVQAIVQTVTDAATELSGAKFGAFFYTLFSENSAALELFTLSGAPREAFERLGHPRDTALFGPTFRGEGPIRIDDVRRDPRYGTVGPHHGMPPSHLPVRSYLAVPVISRTGEVLGALLFGHPEPAVFTARSERIVTAIANHAAVALDNAHLYEAAQKASFERAALLDAERAARSAAERANEVKDEFLSTLSHELRTPLSAILGWAQVLKRGAEPAKLALGLETIERNARVQTQLIDDLLDMSRIASGKLRLEIQSVLPAQVAGAAIETVMPAAAAKGVRIERALDMSAGPVSADPARLQQVVWNLLSNAIKFTSRGGEVRVTVARVNAHVEISVTDTGVGIDAEFLPHVFERFQQADSSTTRKFGGLGLGLSIVKNLVELHGGSVQARSPGKDQGATFEVRLPVMNGHAEERRGAPAPEAQASSYTTLDLAGLRILAVDDEPDARVLLGHILGECGAEVSLAENAAQAVALFGEKRPDVIVSDIGMPGMDGYELLRQLRGLEQGGVRVPAIALTAFARTEDRTRALRAGFSLHLAKPVDPSELVAAIAAVAGRTGG